MRGCERCGAGVDDGFDNDKESARAMCYETPLVHGFVVYVCYDCRAYWGKMMRTDSLAKQYTKTVFHLDCWKNKMAASGVGDLKEGDHLWEKLNDIEDKLIDKAIKFMDNN